MYTFKEIDRSSTVIDQNVVNYTHNFTTSSLGIQSIKIVSSSISSSYWNSLNVLYYTSGSPVYGKESKFALSNLSLKPTKGIQHLNKFHGYPSSSIITIPQQYYGEKITEKSFTLTEKSYTDNNGNNPINVYSINCL